MDMKWASLSIRMCFSYPSPPRYSPAPPESIARPSDSTRNGKRASVNSVGRFRESGTTWMVSSPSA